MSVSGNSRQAPHSLAERGLGGLGRQLGWWGLREGEPGSRQGGASLGWGLGSGRELRPSLWHPTAPLPSRLLCAPHFCSVTRAPESLLWVPIRSRRCTHVCTSRRVRVLGVYTCACGHGGGGVGGPMRWGQQGAIRDLGVQLRRAAAASGPTGVYCYRVNRRLFLVPSDPGAPCRLCRTPRDEKRPETRVQTAQVR